MWTKLESTCPAGPIDLGIDLRKWSPTVSLDKDLPVLSVRPSVFDLAKNNHGLRSIASDRFFNNRGRQVRGRLRNWISSSMVHR